MSSYVKPQSPLYHKTEDTYFYPLTTVDQVMLENGERLNAKLEDFAVVDDGLTKEGFAADAKVVGDAINRLSTQDTPRNLLDNSDFRTPVNQRGLTEYSNVEYTIDRWKWSYAADTRKCNVHNGSIEVINESAATGYFVQVLGNVAKETPHTLALKRNGEISCHVINWGGLTDGLEIDNLGMVYGQTDRTTIAIAVNIGATISGIEWIALYEGEYTLDTLPEYQPKGYTVELAECQRYARVLPNGYSIRAAIVSVNTLQAYIPLGIPMRIVPSIESGTIMVANLPTTTVSGFIVSITSASHGFVKIMLSKTSHGLSDGMIRCTSDVVLSSDL